MRTFHHCGHEALQPFAAQPNTNNRASTPEKLWIYVCRVHKPAEETLEEQWALNSVPELNLYQFKVMNFLNC